MGVNAPGATPAASCCPAICSSYYVYRAYILAERVDDLPMYRHLLLRHLCDLIVLKVWFIALHVLRFSTKERYRHVIVNGRYLAQAVCTFTIVYIYRPEAFTTSPTGAPGAARHIFWLQVYWYGVQCALASARALIVVGTIDILVVCAYSRRIVYCCHTGFRCPILHSLSSPSPQA